jgi:hypothetical protein
VCTPSAGTNTAVATSVPVAAAPATIYQRLLVMIMDYTECGFAPGINASTTRSIFLGPDGDGSGGVAQRYTQCSYGAFNINASALQVITVPQRCSTSVTASCSWWAISNGGDTTAKSQLGTNVFSDFTHYIYIVPPGLSSVCPWAGLALLPGKQVWLQTSSYGVYRWATIMQEAIHNYGKTLVSRHVFDGFMQLQLMNACYSGPIIQSAVQLNGARESRARTPQRNVQH